MQLSPKSAIPVAYTASIPGDTTLYYVQAVLRDTASSTILQTIDLVRESSVPNRYVGSFEPVSDPSGLGRPVDITTTVYNDAGYSDPSLNYQILQLSYVVLQPFIANLGNGGGGSNISYEKITAMILAALDARPKEDSSDKVVGAIKGMPLVEVDYERLETLLEQLSANSKTYADSSNTALRAEVNDLIRDMRSEIGVRHDTGKTEVMDRIGALERSLNASDTSHGEARDAMKVQMQTEMGKLFSALKKEYGANADVLHDKMVGSVSDKFLDTLADREVHVHLNMGGKEKKTKNDERMSTFDPTKILHDLLA